jgi:pilus assembly protein CpaE
MVTHGSGLRVMGAEPERLLLSDEVSHDRLSSLLDLIAESHDHLVIDLPRQIDLPTTTILERADRIVLVLQQGITHVRDAARLMDVLRQELEINDTNITVVLNRFQKNGAIKLADVSRALHHDPVLTVPNDFKHVTDCLNNGTPLLVAARRAPITRSLTALAGHLEQQGRRETPSMLKRMVSLLRRT